MAVGATVNGGYATQSIYHAPNIKPGTNTATVKFSASAQFPDVRIAEYSGVSELAAFTASPVRPLDSNPNPNPDSNSDSGS